jgi:hypothetical protein
LPVFGISKFFDIGGVPTVPLVVSTPPRLSCALQTTPAPRPATISGTSTDIVKGILAYIWGRLAGGLDPAWTGPDGGTFDPNDVEEQWARTITGMMLGSCYMSPATAYFSGSDQTYYDALEGGGPFPLAVMCQQSCTVALISRGFTHPDYSNAGTTGLNAGGSEGRPIWQKTGAKWLPGTTTPDLRSVAGTMAATPTIGPGAMYEFALATPNSGPAHIAYLLRVPRKSTNKSIDAIQFFDTGGMNVATRTDSPCVDGIGIFDDPWVLGTVPGPTGGSAAFKGVGVLPPPPNLSGSVATMKKAWPLGFCRLILRRSSGGVMYASPLLPMCHSDDPLHNFSVATLLWSLRGIPSSTVVNEEGADGFGSAEWNVFVPRGSVTSQTLKEGRAATLRQVVSKLPAGTGFPAAEKPTALVAHLMWHSHLSVDSSDKLHFARKLQFDPEQGDTRPAIPGKGGDTIPWGIRTGDAIPAASDIPTYFIGGEP